MTLPRIVPGQVLLPPQHPFHTSRIVRRLCPNWLLLVSMLAFYGGSGGRRGLAVVTARSSRRSFVVDAYSNTPTICRSYLHCCHQVPASRSRSIHPSRTDLHRFPNHSLRHPRPMKISCSFSTLPTFLEALSSSSYDDKKDEPDIDTLLQSLQDRVTQLNNGIPINVQSPKQVSMALFGVPDRSVAQSVLQQLLQNQELGIPSSSSQQQRRQRDLAECILSCRRLLRRKQQEQQPTTSSIESPSSRRSFSSSVSTTTQEDDEDEDDAIPTTTSSGSTSTFSSSSYEQVVDSLVDRLDSQVDPYWREPLKQLTRPIVRDLLLPQLDPTQCPMAFDPNATPGRKRGGTTNTSTTTTTATSTAGKKGTFLAFCREQKTLHPTHILLVRMGDFYETFGIDALMLVEHAGLNPMGSKAKAGCPYRNVQATLNCLIEQGFSVAVYEEVGQTASNKLKTRVLSQIVSPASPLYLYDSSWLLGSDNGSGLALEQLPPSRPCVGIVHTSAGYHMVECSLEERSVQYAERLTPEAVACRLAAYPPAEPLVYIPSPTEQQNGRLPGGASRLPFLPMEHSTPTSQELTETHLGGYRIRTVVVPPHLVTQPVNNDQEGASASEAQRYIDTILQTLLQWNEKNPTSGEDDKPSRKIAPHDFTLTESSTTTHPLYLETASQLGLLQDPAIPSLIAHVLDEAAPASTRRFLKRYLLVPPPPRVARAMAETVATLKDDASVVLPRLSVPPLGKVLSLIRAGQASAAIYGELLYTLAVTRFVVENESSRRQSHKLPVAALLTLCSHESGLVAEQSSLAARCQAAMDAIEAVLCPSHHVEDELLWFGDDGDGTAPFFLEDPLTHYEYLPDSFVERNELSWRGRVQRQVAEHVYARVEQAGRKLDEALARDFILGDESNRALVAQDIFNNLLVLKKIPSQASKSNDYIHPRDRHGKKLATRFSTDEVQQALSDYVAACDDACQEVSSILSDLATSLQDEGHIPVIIQSAHLNLALSAAYHHAVKATKQQWSLAKVLGMGDETQENVPASSARFVGVWPYWMPKNQAVSNSFDLNGMFLLTAPNMSGKSTLMRATAAAALLSVCGLCAPLSPESQIPRFDTLFLRGASADVPAENKSAFGAEMEDIAALMRCCGPQSLVFVDEIGRGTSPRDGARLAAAILEAMAGRGMSGIFATHLHDILNLPLRSKERIITKQMAIAKSQRNDDGETYDWTYRLEDGICNDSLAMVTAARFGLPDEIIRRADELDKYLPQNKVALDHDQEAEVEIEEEIYSVVKTREAKQYVASFANNGYDFRKAVALLEEIAGSASPAIIPARANPPPALANKACVYLLELNSDPPKYYVGETEALLQRLSNHRKKGPAWSACKAAVLPLASKSEARIVENQLIQSMAQAGFAMESIRDGRAFRQ